MGKIENFRKVLALPEVIENVELTNKLKEVYTDYLELLEKNSELNSKLKEITDVSDIKKKAKVYSGYYTIEGVKDVDGNEIPFCFNCLYEHGIQIPMMYGIVERGTMELFSGQTISPNVFGLSCRKCNMKLVLNTKEENRKNK